jgi:hypothetical protein
MRAYRSRDIVQAFQWHSGARTTKLDETLLVTPGHFKEPDLRGCGVVRNPHSIGDGAIVHHGDWVCVRNVTWTDGTTSRIVTVLDEDSFKAGFEPIDQAVLEEPRIERTVTEDMVERAAVAYTGDSPKAWAAAPEGQRDTVRRHVRRILNAASDTPASEVTDKVAKAAAQVQKAMDRLLTHGPITVHHGGALAAQIRILTAALGSATPDAEGGR